MPVEPSDFEAKSALYLPREAQFDFLVNLPDNITSAGLRNKDGQPVKDKASTACVVADATACCAEGIEFVCGDGSVYPQDYPEIGTEITVTGTFQIDEEEGFTWYYLADAEMNRG